MFQPLQSVSLLQTHYRWRAFCAFYDVHHFIPSLCCCVCFPQQFRKQTLVFFLFVFLAPLPTLFVDYNQSESPVKSFCGLGNVALNITSFTDWQSRTTDEVHILFSWLFFTVIVKSCGLASLPTPSNVTVVTTTSLTNQRRQQHNSFSLMLYFCISMPFVHSASCLNGAI